MIINTNRPADILEGTRECVAGNGPRAACKHLAALSFALVDYDQNKLYEACTQRLQQWHQPTRKSSNPVPLLNIRFTRLHHNRNEEKNLKYSKFFANYTYAPKASTTLNQLLIKYDQQSSAAAFFLLPGEDKNSFISLPARIIGAVPNSLDFILNSLMLKYYKDHVYLLPIQISNLEQITRGQSSSDQWHEARKLRISSTNVYDIAVQAKDFKKLAKSILDNQSKDLSFIPAMRHSILNEEMCRRRYVTEKDVNGIVSITHPCGLVVDPTAPYLCCSPDAVVVESINNIMSYGILECKCVHAEPNATWDDLITVREHFCLEKYGDHLRLRTDHPYFYQLITLMGILDLSWIDICIMKGNDVHIQRFIHDESIWSMIKQKLTNFYFNFFLFEVVKIH
ncbi:unnamed protein product [Rotaria magnacalcarata]|nr:unnamed protein product [Rotaria magnacalcarata]